MNLTVGKKLAVGIGLVLLLLMAVSVVSYYSLTDSLAKYDDLSGRIRGWSWPDTWMLEYSNKGCRSAYLSTQDHLCRRVRRRTAKIDEALSR